MSAEIPQVRQVAQKKINKTSGFMKSQGNNFFSKRL